MQRKIRRAMKRAEERKKFKDMISSLLSKFKKSKDEERTFVLTLRLKTTADSGHILNTRMEIARNIYNACLGSLLKKYKALSESKKYRRLVKLFSSLSAEIQSLETKQEVMLKAGVKGKDNKKLSEIKKSLSSLTSEKSKVYKELTNIESKVGLTEYKAHDDVKPMQHHFKSEIDSLTAQKIASRAYAAIEKLIKRQAKSVYFKKVGDLNSVEGKSNASGIRFIDNTIEWNKIKIPVIIREKDDYACEALLRKVKYCRILRRKVKGKDVFYVQLVLAGFPPPKRTKEGAFKQVYGDGRVGIDPSLRTIALTSDDVARLIELAPPVDCLDKKIKPLQRYLDRSRRATNPNKYNADGTIKRGNRDKWVFSKKYKKALAKIQDLWRKKSIVIKQEHERLCNYILTLGTEVYCETMNFKALAKRAKETKRNKEGKIQSKKRFGKSIGTKAPGKFLEILQRKLGYIGLKINYVNTRTFKASQYNHITDTCQKKKLSERWHDFGEIKIQRDLYSAFLIMNSESNLLKTDRNLCQEKFGIFKVNHNKEIQSLCDKVSRKLPKSFGIRKVAQ